ncbi:MAG TPA: MFS transporter [Novosphingobium sp.]|nr:MFS transporter [Novosphingobium sp.]
MESPRTFGSSWAAYILCPLLLTIGACGLFVAPFVIEVASRIYRLSEAAAGGIVTAEVIFSAFTALGLANVFSRIDVARLCFWALVITVAGNILSCLSYGVAWFVVCRIVAGLSSGVLYASAAYWAAQHHAGVRVMSASFIVASVVYGLGFVVWPSAVLKYGFVPIYGLLVALCLAAAAALAVFGCPRPSLTAEFEQHELEPKPAYALWVLLLMCALANGGLQMLWSFSLSVAAIRKFDVDTVGIVLGLSGVFNIIGSLLAGFLDRRFGVALPLALGILLGCLAGLSIGASGAMVWFATGIFLYGMSAFFVMPYLFSAGAALDNQGRAVTLSGFAVYFAGALSPLLGGVIADRISLAAVGWVSAAACFGAAICALVLRSSLD